MTSDEATTINEEIKSHFNGREPITELSALLASVSEGELRGLVLVAANKLGEVMNGGRHATPFECGMYMNLGAQVLLDTFLNHSMGKQVTTSEVGTA